MSYYPAALYAEAREAHGLAFDKICEECSAPVRDMPYVSRWHLCDAHLATSPTLIPVLDALVRMELAYRHGRADALKEPKP